MALITYTTGRGELPWWTNVWQAELAEIRKTTGQIPFGRWRIEFLSNYNAEYIFDEIKNEGKIVFKEEKDEMFFILKYSYEQ